MGRDEWESPLLRFHRGRRLSRCRERDASPYPIEALEVASDISAVRLVRPVREAKPVLKDTASHAF